MHSKDEPLFRVGACYKQRNGDVVRLHPLERGHLEYGNPEVAWARPVSFEADCGYGFRSLSTGRHPCNVQEDPEDLIPGECDVQGNPIDSDGLSDALSEQAKHLKAEAQDAGSFKSELVIKVLFAMVDELRGGPAKPETLGDLLRPYLSGEKQAVVHGKFTMTPTLDAMEADPNAAMIARDEKEKRCPANRYQPTPLEQWAHTGVWPATSHPPIAGLMRENGFSHKLGSANLGKCA